MKRDRAHIILNASRASLRARLPNCRMIALHGSCYRRRCPGSGLSPRSRGGQRASVQRRCKARFWFPLPGRTEETASETSQGRRPVTALKRFPMPERSKNDTRGSGVSPIFECRIASYDRPPSGERFENLSLRSVQIRAHDCVRIRSGLLAYYSRQSCTDPRR